MLIVLEWVLKAIWAVFCFLFEFMGEIFLSEGLTAVLERSEKPGYRPMRVQCGEENTRND